MTLQEKLALALENARTAYENLNIEEGDGFKAEAETLSKAIKSLQDTDSIAKSAAPVRPTLPGVGDGATPVESREEERKATKSEAESHEETVVKSVYSMRFGDDTDVKSVVLGDLVGNDYKQVIYDQHRAFNQYLRGGERAIDRNQEKLLKTQIFPYSDIEGMVKNGYSVSEIKSTMVEAQGSLGGYAVPTTMQSEIIRRLPGNTVVRGGGARVVNLTSGNSTEILEITGGNDRYTGNIRGLWGSETEDPTSRNMTLGMKTLNADVYTYKVPMSQSLVEDATNLVSLLQDEASMALAMDEDEAFLIGDGAGKPLGILPGSANGLSLSEVNTGAASAITADGLKSLRRGIAWQYRENGTFVANSDTAEDIELLKDGEGRYLFDIDSGELLRRRMLESEAMPDVAASAFPIIFGNMMGYTILERSGMTIARFQDSNTGINKVEYHIRRRVGGRVTHPFMFAVQAVSA